MRVIITARQTLIPVYADTLRRLVAILGTICKNPSNPNFDQYIFESISGLMRCVFAFTSPRMGEADFGLWLDSSYLAIQPRSRPSSKASSLLSPSSSSKTSTVCPSNLLALFSPTHLPRFSPTEYIPYVFQILSQMLELHASAVPDAYRALLPHLLTPAAWAQKGSIPGLVRLLKAYVAKDGAAMVAGGQVASVLAVVQQRLIPSKVNDAWGFELLQGVVGSISACVASLSPPFPPFGCSA